jgi:hypothetical protein
MSTPVNSSEVARLRAQIDAEYAAAFAGLYGLSAGSARHDFIHRRMERVAEIGEQLIERIGKEAAMPLILEAMESGSRQGQREQSRSEEVPLSFPGNG